jgi:hypothetical protein
VRLPEDERLSHGQWFYCAARREKELGLAAQTRA